MPQELRRKVYTSEQEQKDQWNGRSRDTEQTQEGLRSSKTAYRKRQKSCIDRKGSLGWFTQIPGHGHVTFCFAHLPLSLCLLVQKGPSQAFLPSSEWPSCKHTREMNLLLALGSVCLLSRSPGASGSMCLGDPCSL